MIKITKVNDRYNITIEYNGRLWGKNVDDLSGSTIKIILIELQKKYNLTKSQLSILNIMLLEVILKRDWE